MAKGKKKEEQKTEEKGRENLSPLQKEIYVLFVLVISILFGLSYFNKAGLLGEAISYLLFGMIGAIAYILPIYMIGVTLFYLANRDKPLMVKKCWCSGVMVFIFMSLLHLLTYQNNNTLNVIILFQDSAKYHRGGGLFGGIFANLLATICGEVGAYVILLALLAIAFMFMSEKLLFHNLKKKSSVAYHKMKERAEIIAEEKAQERARDEDLEELEDWEEEKPSFGFRFFNFKKEFSEEEEEEALSSENTQGVSGNMKEITVDFSAEKELEEEQTEEDEWSDLVIHRANQEETEEEETPLPIHQQEILQKFAAEEAKKESEEPVQEELTDEFLTSLESNLHEYADTAFDDKALSIEKGESGQGVVMDAMEDAQTQSPEAAMYQLQQPVKENNGDRKENVSSGLERVSAGEADKEAVAKAAAAKKKKKKKYVFPTTDLLTKPEKCGNGVSDDELKKRAKKLQDTLESFGVGAKVTNVSCGPTVTRFELQPDQGVKVSKITALADDIKLNMAAEEIRIEAPIPGKAAVGIEVPNETTSMVHFRDVVENGQFKKHKSKLSFAVGKDIGGQAVVTDIAKMPHLLIAGATGSGKSVCINTLIMSILYKASPDDVKLIMIDPKVVELSCYKGIPHLLIPVVTDPKKASAALQWAVQEMSERYKKFADVGVREIGGYNERIKAVEYAEDERFQKMPQIVIIVDELADLMMVASKEVEEAICRLAQLARAAGIHLVIATQRPSVNVITGLIKANVPSRIAFAVSSVVDSRTILDGGGAEKLLGKGDMLFYPSGFPKPVRVQGAFVSDEEVNRVVSFIIEKNEVEEEDAGTAEIEAKMQHMTVGESGSSGSNSGNDDYFEEAGRFIIEKNKASIGMLQRVYKIGFNRAARIMDQLCAAGVVGPEEGTKPRKVLMTMEEFDSYISG